MWTVVGGGAYASKPRPVVIIQTDLVDTTASVLVCPFTSNPAAAPLFRPEVAPSADNGLAARSWVMTDKLVAVPPANVEKRIGALAADDVARIERAIAFILGLGG